MREITERTTISLAIVATLIGGSLWLSKIYFMAEAAAISAEKVSLRQDKYNEDISQLREDIAVIKNIVEKKGK